MSHKSSQEIDAMEKVADAAFDLATAKISDPMKTADGEPAGAVAATAWALIAIERRLAIIAAYAERSDG